MFIKRKRSKKKKIKSNVGRSCYYIGRTKDTGSRIVYFEGKVLKESKETYLCKFVDRNIDVSDEPFEKEVPKYCLHFNN